MNTIAMPHVGIIGGGGTGCALAWDLSLRGYRVSLFEQGELTSGTTGRHHGQLHSGARYAVGDRAIARECMQETLILRSIVPGAIEYNGGLFVALSEEEAAYGDRFLQACLESGIPARDLPLARALELEPAINPALLRAIWVPDGTFDAFRVPLSFAAAAKRLGARFHTFSRVQAVSSAAGRVDGLCVCGPDHKETVHNFDAVVNATGAWAALLGHQVGARIPLTPAAGSMVAVRGRLSDLVVSRLAPPGDGDIIVPQRGLSIIGSTQRQTESPEGLHCLPDELEFLLGRAEQLVPGFRLQPVHAAWAAARPLAGISGGDEGRSISRDLKIIDHAPEGLAGFFSVIGGKATVLRAMAEHCADRVCAYFGREQTCRTRQYKLPSWREFYCQSPDGSWTASNPGLPLVV